MKTTAILIVFLAGIACRAEIAPQFQPNPMPELETVVLEPIATLGEGPAKENSGIVKSRTRENVYWMMNDSGDEPRIYAIKKDGSVWGAQRYEGVSGVYIGGAINVDWEDIAVDASGNVLIADLGNNCNCRRDMSIYVVPEPRPDAGRAPFLKQIFVRYSDQPEIPAPSYDFNYDCEGIFTIKDTIYVLSKNRSDTFTKLYKLKDPKLGEINKLKYVGAFDVRGKSTASDATEDGLQLVITTYDHIWHFKRNSRKDSFFSGDISVMRFEADQVEAVCFDDKDTILLACEKTAELYEVKLTDLTPYHPDKNQD
jgi:hypothetical protein